MCVGAPRRCAVWLLLAGSTLIADRAKASVAPAAPADSLFMVPDLHAPERLPLGGAGDLRFAAGDSAPVPPAAPAEPAPTMHEPISDPLPPAFWPGVSVLCAGTLFVGMRRFKRLLS